MELRSQRNGKQMPWSIEELEQGLKHFYAEHGRYPTATEVDADPYLPSARSIERRFGGLVALRKKLSLGVEYDFRAGAHSSQRAHLINARAHRVEQTIYAFLVKHFGKEFVHREYFFTDDHRTRADFFVYDAHKGFCVDVFYPNSPRNLTGCLNIKLSKYNGMQNFFPYPLIFLQMNEEISQDVLERILSRKERKLSPNQHLMGRGPFEKFCLSRKSLRVA